MKKTKRILKSFLSLGILMILLECSTLSGFYVQNFSKSEKSISIYYKGNISHLLNDKKIEFTYENSLIKTKKFRKIRNKKTLEIESINDSTITFKIPPRSTTDITWNYARLISKVEINEEKYTFEELAKLSKWVKGDYILKIK